MAGCHRKDGHVTERLSILSRKTLGLFRQPARLNAVGGALDFIEKKPNSFVL
jgi:hypothetical protein